MSPSAIATSAIPQSDSRRTISCSQRACVLAGARPNCRRFSGPEAWWLLPSGAKEETQMIAWILTGLIAGWLAGKVMKGGGYGIIIDIVLGLLGGVVGGWLFGLLGIWHGGGMIPSIIVAFVGAVIL